MIKQANLLYRLGNGNERLILSFPKDSSINITSIRITPFNPGWYQPVVKGRHLEIDYIRDGGSQLSPVNVFEADYLVDEGVDSYKVIHIDRFVSGLWEKVLDSYTPSV
ncbi:MAG: hypothetical protein M1284_02935 [Candidatus Parvarchaeota archaeon]|nr:hypothetical protein [Candidatus Parvarchaeota archaeon]